MAVYSISRLSKQLSSPSTSPLVQYSVNIVLDDLSDHGFESNPKVGDELCNCRGEIMKREIKMLNSLSIPIASTLSYDCSRASQRFS